MSNNACHEDSKVDQAGSNPGFTSPFSELKEKQGILPFATSNAFEFSLGRPDKHNQHVLPRLSNQFTDALTSFSVFGLD